MKYLLIALLFCCSFASADYTRVASGHSFTIFLGSDTLATPLTATPFTDRDKAIATAYNKVKLCMILKQCSEAKFCDCEIKMSSEVITIGAKAIGSTVTALAPNMRIDGKELTVSEHGGYVLKINNEIIDIPRTSGVPLNYTILFPVVAADDIKLAFYDIDKRQSDFVPVVISQ
jgi:hypothetical protein